MACTTIIDTRFLRFRGSHRLYANINDTVPWGEQLAISRSREACSLLEAANRRVNVSSRQAFPRATYGASELGAGWRYAYDLSLYRSLNTFGSFL